MYTHFATNHKSESKIVCMSLSQTLVCRNPIARRNFPNSYISPFGGPLDTPFDAPLAIPLNNFTDTASGVLSIANTSPLTLTNPCDCFPSAYCACT